jgi:uncharacterized protein Yka (UPF0111/DUF47 family)
MADNSGSKDKYLMSLDFIINALKVHEQNLDKSIDNLETFMEQIGDIKGLNDKIEKIEGKIDSLHQEIINLLATYQKNQKTYRQTQ